MVHLGQAQVIEAQQFHRARILGGDADGDVVHDIGDAHQPALELPAVDGRRHPGLLPELEPHQRHGQQQPGNNAAQIPAKIIAAGFAEQAHGGAG